MIFEQIGKALEQWGEGLASELREELTELLSKDHGRIQEPYLKIEPIITVTANSASVQIDMDPYWKYIEQGRKRGAKQPPSKALGKKWQNLHGIDARKILVEINKKKGIKTEKKKLNYKKSVDQVAFMFARSIKRKGIKPKPFIKNTLTDARINDLKDKLGPIIKNAFEIQITV